MVISIIPQWGTNTFVKHLMSYACCCSPGATQRACECLRMCVCSKALLEMRCHPVSHTEKKKQRKSQQLPFWHQLSSNRVLSCENEYWMICGSNRLTCLIRSAGNLSLPQKSWGELHLIIVWCEIEGGGQPRPTHIFIILVLWIGGDWCCNLSKIRCGATVYERNHYM